MDLCVNVRVCVRENVCVRIFTCGCVHGCEYGDTSAKALTCDRVFMYKRQNQI